MEQLSLKRRDSSYILKKKMHTFRSIFGRVFLSVWGNEPDCNAKQCNGSVVAYRDVTYATQLSRRWFKKGGGLKIGRQT